MLHHKIHIIKKIEEKSCQNEGTFKTIVFKRFQPFVMQLVFLILFNRYISFLIVHKSPKKNVGVIHSEQKNFCLAKASKRNINTYFTL